MKIKLLLMLLFFSKITFSQTLHLIGVINLDIEKGSVHCIFKFINNDKNGSYSILFNRGYNVKYFKLNNQVLDAARKSIYNSIEYDIYKANSSGDDLPLTSVENIEVV
jgi:hypothetical protein